VLPGTWATLAGLPTIWAPSGLDRVASVRVTSSAPDGRKDSATRVFRARLYDRAPVYLPTGADAHKHRLDITADVSDTGEWADRARYVTVSSCPAADAGWGFDWRLAAGEPVRYTLVDKPPHSQEQSTGQPDHQASRACDSDS
jgi:hypothetical protein